MLSATTLIVQAILRHMLGVISRLMMQAGSYKETATAGVRNIFRVGSLNGEQNRKRINENTSCNLFACSGSDPLGL